jgi:hypothetical protein
MEDGFLPITVREVALMLLESGAHCGQGANGRSTPRLLETDAQKVCQGG